MADLATTADTHAGSGPAPGLDLGSKIVVIVAGLTASLSISAITSVLPQIDRALAHTPSDSLLVKQLVGAVALAMVVGSTLVGFLIDRYPISRIVTVFGILYAVAGTAGLYLSDLWWLLGSRFLVGIASASIQVGVMTMINKRLEGVQRAQWMGLHIFSAMFSGLISNPLAGALGEFGWRWPFLLYLVGLLLVPAGLMQVDQLGESRRIAAEARRNPGAEVSIFRWFPFRYLALGFCVGGVVLMPVANTPYLLREHGMVHPSMIALVMTADAVAGSISALLYGRARRYISAHVAFLYSFGTAAVGMGIAAVAPNVVWVIVGLLIYGCGVGWFVPNLMTALAARLAPEFQGRGTGLVKAAHFLSAPVSIAAVEPLVHGHGHGHGAALGVGAAVSAVCFVVILLRWLSRGGGGEPAPQLVEQAA